VPSTIVHARYETAIPFSFGEELATMPDARLHAIDTDSHYLPWTHTQECARAIVSQSQRLNA
jgi:hypothetical protein